MLGCILKEILWNKFRWCVEWTKKRNATEQQSQRDQRLLNPILVLQQEKCAN